MRSQVTFSGHILLLSCPAWGHLRSISGFACKVVKERPDVAVTLLTVGGYRKRVEHEVRRHFSGSEECSMDSIRIVNMDGQEFEHSPRVLFPLMNKEFPSYYEKLTNSEPVRCQSTKTTFYGIRRPNVVVVDIFLLDCLHTIRSVTGKNVPVYAWSSANASVTIRLLGPEKLGGLGDVAMKARRQAELTGKKVGDFIHELCRPASGNVVNLPGLPPMYDYEFYPQEPSLFTAPNELMLLAYRFVEECDGFVASTSTTYEAASVEATRGWLGETSRPMFTVGPLLPPGAGGSGLSEIAKRKEVESSDSGAECLVFLDKTLESHGEKSLIYVSFGSIWWPKCENVWAFVNTLLELGIPFILSHASPKATFPPGFSEKVKGSGIGLMSAWSPQQTILNHPATGWFMTHAGQNSVIEALALGIPMIAWPLNADQPANAAHLALTLDVAFELIEVRTGRFGLMPLRRGLTPVGGLEAVKEEARSILQKVRGPEGERKRKHAEILRDKLKGEWEKGGAALSELRNFLTSTPFLD